MIRPSEHPERLSAPPASSQSSNGQPAHRTWTKAAPCDEAWASTPKAKTAGVYKWFLAGDLPPQFHWPEHLTPITVGDLIYAGKASNLRARAKHHKLQTYSSSLRRTLASLVDFPAVWQGTSAHPRISREHNAALSRWMTGNLLMSFSELHENENLTDVENALRRSLKAPLNKDSLTPEQLYVLDVGDKWQAAACRS